VTERIEVRDFSFPNGWQAGDAQRSRWYCAQLEAGAILEFAAPPFEFSESDRDFLISQRRADSAIHKNVSYRPAENSVRGFKSTPEVDERLRVIMRNYSRRVVEFFERFLLPYAKAYTLDFASFRPLEESGRTLPLHKRNDLLHVDAFPTRPTHGGRILRIFTNIHPAKPRVWNAGEDFTTLAAHLAKDAGLDRFAASGRTPGWQRVLGTIGLPFPDRSAYDRFMLRFHDYLKENATYQTDSPKTHIEFPPMRTWLAYTDGVPHAVMSGQHALEQTFIVALSGLVTPEVAPVHLLEKLCGRALIPAAR
jgi:hypothetical protein